MSVFTQAFCAILGTRCCFGWTIEELRDFLKTKVSPIMVDPQLNGHPWDTDKWPLYGGRPPLNSRDFQIQRRDDIENVA